MRFLRPLGNMVFTADGQDTIKIPKNDAIRAIYLDVALQLDVTVNGTAIVDQAPYTLIKKARLIANGTRDLCSVRGKYLKHVNKRMNGSNFQFSAPSTFNVQAATQLRFMVEIPMRDGWLRRPIETMLEARGLSTLDLEVLFGNASDIITGGTKTITNVVVRVSAEYEIDVPMLTEKNQDGSVKRVGTDQIILATRALYEKEMTITAATSSMKFDLDPRNNHSRFFIFTESDGVLVNTILNKVTLKSGQKVHYSLNRVELHDLNAGEFMLETQDAGVYVLNFLTDGLLAQGLASGKEQSLELELDVNKPGTTDVVRVVCDEFYLPPLR